MRPLRFKRLERQAPDTSLIAFIGVLLVILIFLVLSSSYSRLTQDQVKPSVADSQAAPTVTQRIHLALSADGRYALGDEPLAPVNLYGLARARDDVLLVACSNSPS